MANYLPGVNVTLNDLGLKVAPPPAGPKVTLLGVTSNPSVKIKEAYTVTSVEKAMNTLYFELPANKFRGPDAGTTDGVANVRVPGELALAVEEAINGGASNVEVMVINVLSGAKLFDYICPEVDPTGRYHDLAASYNLLKNRDLDVVSPVGVYMDTEFTGANYVTYNFGKQLADFCYQVTNESNSAVGTIGVEPPTLWIFKRRGELGKNLDYSGEIVNMFGLYGTDAERSAMFTGAISGIPEFTKEKKTNVMSGVYFGVPSTALISEWHAYHTYPGDLTKSSIGGLPANAITNEANYSTVYLKWLKGAANQDGKFLDEATPLTTSAVSSDYFAGWQAEGADGAAVDGRGNKVDAGAFLSVFSAPVRTVGTLVKSMAIALGASPGVTSMNSSGAVCYAGKITSLSPQSSTTNKTLGGVTPLRLLSASQANDMTGMRHVTMYTRTKGFTIASGCTGAYNVNKYIRSDYTRLTTMRITATAVDLVRSVAEKYVGEPNNAPQMNALDAEIDQLLLSMKGQGALNSYDFSISSTPDQRVLGQLDINLTLVPAFEIQEINLVVSLSKGL